MTIDVVLWDVMGTLVHDPFFDEMPRFFGMSFDELLAAKHPNAWIEFELGKLTEDEFLRRFFADGRDYDRRGFVEDLRRSYRWLPGLESLLESLANGGFVMHAFSNYPVWYELIEERLAPSRFLDWSFVSCRTGFRKPAPGAYGYVLDQLGVPPERCVFIDDRASNCDAARASGIRAVKFDGVDSLVASLRDEGLRP